MNTPSPQSQPPDSVWYGWILKLFHHWKVGERQVTYVWAVLVGMVGSCMSLFFEWMESNGCSQASGRIPA